MPSHVPNRKPSCLSVYIVYIFDLTGLVWGAGGIRRLCKMALMGASDERHTAGGHGADCDATERDVHRPASHTGGPQALSNPPLQGLVRSALGKRGKPVGRYVDFQLERSVRGLSRSHMLFDAWGMAATRLGSKWDNSKAHPKGVSSFVHNLKWDNSKIHRKGICLFVYNLKYLCFFQVLLNNYCIALFLVEPPTSSWLQQALPMRVGEEVQPGKLMGESAHPGTSPGGVRVCGGRCWF